MDGDSDRPSGRGRHRVLPAWMTQTSGENDKSYQSSGHGGKGISSTSTPDCQILTPSTECSISSRKREREESDQERSPDKHPLQSKQYHDTNQTRRYRSHSPSPPSLKKNEAPGDEPSPGSSFSSKSNSIAPPTAAVVCDRILELRNLSSRKKSSQVDLFEKCLASKENFLAEDRHGREMSRREVVQRFFLDGSDKVTITKRVVFNNLPDATISLDFEQCGGHHKNQIVLYVEKKGVLTRIYIFKDKDELVDPNVRSSLEDLKTMSRVFKRVLKYAQQKGLEPQGEILYYDYIHDVSVI